MLFIRTLPFVFHEVIQLHALPAGVASSQPPLLHGIHVGTETCAFDQVVAEPRNEADFLALFAGFGRLSLNVCFLFFLHDL